MWAAGGWLCVYGCGCGERTWVGSDDDQREEGCMCVWVVSVEVGGGQAVCGGGWYNGRMVGWMVRKE